MVFRFLIYLVIAYSVIYPQDVVISEILDANLFRLNNEKVVKLAGVDTPTMNSSIPFLNKIAYNSKLFIKKFFNKPLTIIKINHNTFFDYDLVYLRKGELDLSSECLANGFGKFVNNVPSDDTLRLLNTEKIAKENLEGIWKYFTPTKDDTLDLLLKSSPMFTELVFDKNKYNEAEASTLSANIIIPEFLASACGILLSTLSGAVIGKGIHPSPLSSQKDLDGAWTGAWIGGLIGLTIVSPSAVYLVAKPYNPRISLPYTILFSSGAIVSTYLLLNLAQSPITFCLFLMSPILGPILYVHLIAPQTPSIQELIPDQKVSLKSFKDYRQAQTIKVELLRMNF